MASEALDKFFPTRYLTAGAKQERIEYEGRIVEKWSSLRGKSALDCVRIFLTCTRKWQFFGARLFEVQVRKRIIYVKMNRSMQKYLMRAD